MYDLGDLWDDTKDVADSIGGTLEDVTTFIKDSFLGKDEEPEKNPILGNARSNVAPLPVIYGTRRVGGALVYVAAAGDTNQYLHLVLALGEGPISAVTAVYLDDVDINDARFVLDGTPYASFTAYLGADGQAASGALITAFPGVWTASHTLSGVAYLHVVLTFNRDMFTRVPVITADVSGRTVFDPRTSTTGFSKNPALCLRDYLTNTRYGKGLPSTVVDVTAAANHCDELVALYVGGLVDAPRYTCNGALDTRKRIAENVRSLLSACNGALINSGGVYRLHIDQPEASQMTLTPDTILGNWSIASSGNSGLLNRIKASFDNPEKNWQEDSLVYDDATLRSTQDNGYLLESTLDLPFTTDGYRAQRLAQLLLLQSRLKLRVAFVATLAALRVDVGNIVAVTHPTPAWTAKLFRVVKLDLLPTGNIGVALEEYSFNAYTLQLPGQFVPPPATNLPNPFTVLVPANLTLQSGTDHLLVGSSGDLISRIYVSWVKPNDGFVVGYDVQAKRSNTSVWLPVASPSSATDVNCYIAPVLDSVLYDVRVRCVNSLQRRSAWVTVSNYSVVGKTEPPPPLSAFLIRAMPDGTRDLTWLYPAPPLDHGGFSVRYKLGTGAVWQDMTPLPGAELISGGLRAAESNQLAAGTYTLAMAAVDTSGNESTPLYIQTTLPDPRLAGVIAQVYPRLGGWAGIKTNCIVIETGELIANDTLDWGEAGTWEDGGTWAGTPYGTITYEHPAYDVGVVAAFTPLITVIGTGTQTLTVATSTDGTTYTAFAAPVLVTARYIKVKVQMVVAAPSGTSLPIINDLTLLLSAQTKTEILEDKDTSLLTGSYRIGVGDIRLPITKTYAVIKIVSVTLQNVAAGFSWVLIDKDNVVGPRIKIYNASNVLADCVVDAEITGLS